MLQTQWGEGKGKLLVARFLGRLGVRWAYGTDHWGDDGFKFSESALEKLSRDVLLV